MKQKKNKEVKVEEYLLNRYKMRTLKVTNMM